MPSMLRDITRMYAMRDAGYNHIWSIVASGNIPIFVHFNIKTANLLT